MTSDHTARIAQLEAEIAALTTSIEALANMPDSQRPLIEQRAARQAELERLHQSPAPQLNDVQADRDVNIATQQTINNFFGGKAPEDGKALLDAYLRALIDQLAPLRLARMTSRRQSGRGESLLPPLQLADVFTNLSIENKTLVIAEQTFTAAESEAALKQLDTQQRSPDDVPPEEVRETRLWFHDEPDAGFYERIGKRQGESLSLSDLPPETVLRWTASRPQLALEALHQHSRLVLLGAPGSGKSTALTYLTLLLALALHDPAQHTLPFGWDAAPVPILCPLGRVANALQRKHEKQSDTALLWQELATLLQGEGQDGEQVRDGLVPYLKPALRSGAVLLLFDGLDEVPATPGEDGVSLRTRVSRAVQELARKELPRATRVALTSRVVPYEQAAASASAADDWRLAADDGWVVQRIAPFAFGQVRQFVGNWYAAACRADGAVYPPAVGEQRAAGLLEQLAASERLKKLVESPLLLTMLALLHYNKETGELPRDRARLYDECVELLLDRWEPQRQAGMVLPGLLERLGIAELARTDDLRAVMHRVALQAHDRPPAPGDGRGMLRGSELEGEMSRFLRRLRCGNIEQKLAEFERALRDEAGLLHELGDDVYAFPHLTFQEYLAACALAGDPQMAQRAYGYWSSGDSSRWREVLLLMVGRLRQRETVETQGLEWLRVLLNRTTPDGNEKSSQQHAQDALLAADSYQEWEGRAALASFESDEIEQHEQRLARGLVAGIETYPGMAFEERLRAAGFLGELGDPRFPVTIDDWQRELRRRKQQFGQAAGYFGYVLPGTYHIGGWDDGQAAADITLPEFWIARLPITVAQFALFVAEGYTADAERWWTPKGWQWKENRRRRHPWGWNDPRYTAANQPVIGVTWYEARAYCAWLTEHLRDSLAPGMLIRLPTEAEWEAAAAFDAAGQRRRYPWGSSEPSLDHAVYDASGLQAAAPVGCCPAGAAACGALDMAGNVWEWCNNSYRDYPRASNKGREDFTPRESEVSLRGSYWNAKSTNVRCGARLRDFPDDVGLDLGFRIVVAPPLAHLS
jgi:formylglycine-generating enzyme required for sulfatase activity